MFETRTLQLGDSKKTGGAESLKDFDEAFGLELCIQCFIAGVDPHGFQTDEFGGCGNAQDILVPNQPKDRRRKLEIPSPNQEPLSTHRREQQQQRAWFPIFIHVA